MNNVFWVSLYITLNEKGNNVGMMKQVWRSTRENYQVTLVNESIDEGVNLLIGLTVTSLIHKKKYIVFTNEPCTIQKLCIKLLLILCLT